MVSRTNIRGKFSISISFCEIYVVLFQARYVASACHVLCDAANGLVQGCGTEEKLISSAKQVSSNTAALLVACKVKSDFMSQSMARLQTAGNAVKRAADALEHGEDPVKEWTSSIIAETAKVRLSKIMGTLTNEEAKTALAGLVDDMIHTRDEGEREVFITQLKAMQRTLADTTLAK